MNILPQEEGDFILALRAMSPEDRQALEDLITALAAKDPTAEWLAGLVNAGQVGGRLALDMMRVQTEH